MDSVKALRILSLIVLLSSATAIAAESYNLYSNQIAVIEIKGEITSFVEITKQMRIAIEDPKIKAIVLRVNSPGGRVQSVKEIREYVNLARRSGKPVVSLIEDYSTSGAYYICSASDYIYSHRNSITGSLGVIAIWIDESSKLEEEGVKVWVWKAGKFKDVGVPWRSPTPEEQRLLNQVTLEVYNELIEDIAEGRNLTVEYVKQFANGGSFDGEFAVEKGFADEIGDYFDALNKAAELAGIKEYLVVDLGKREGPHSFLMAIKALMRDPKLLS